MKEYILAQKTDWGLIQKVVYSKLTDAMLDRIFRKKEISIGEFPFSITLPFYSAIYEREEGDYYDEELIRIFQ